jgi:hypothetical protein
MTASAKRSILIPTSFWPPGFALTLTAMSTSRTDSPTFRHAANPPIMLFSLTLFLSALLTFTLQPMIGKMLLPLVGGAPSCWLVTMAYFQMALLAGYAIAHALSHTTIFRHMFAVGVLLLSGVLLFRSQDSKHLPEVRLAQPQHPQHIA